jgi:hypothetical protein
MKLAALILPAVLWLAPYDARAAQDAASFPVRGREQ